MAEDKDHIPPIRWLAALGSAYFLERGLLIVKVPSCKECNQELGGNKLFSIRERTRYLIGRYCKKYGKYLKGTPWEDWELNELSGRLAEYINTHATLERAIDRRLAILEENLRVR